MSWTPAASSRRNCRIALSYFNQKRSLVVRIAQVLALVIGTGGHHQAHDEPVQAKRFSEDENQDHAHEKPRLLRIRTDTSVAYNANCKACREGAHANCEACTKVRVARVC